ncbi:hypothetical protein J0X14_08960 [Muricauda sp. CAU 1633]|uniref:hypothetical protein n=1 Tax=Allomuricauda sp. CAU 1633 TaxID=2816036 RepID=UPI001A8F90C2|nr:hypothetical protein [Muricauda sp. CAU 1633]MBO0322425.1 hypothetical protein [Muricauda sp. CAU 1633]
MRKALKRYLFPLCILLLGGFINHLYADVQDSIENENACFSQYEFLGHASVDTPLVGIEKSLFAEITDVEEQEEKDEDFASYSSDLQFGSYFTAFFYPSVSGQEFRELEINHGLFQPTSITAPYKRHIQFQVFRI